jgi:hypothetical protein
MSNYWLFWVRNFLDHLGKTNFEFKQRLDLLLNLICFAIRLFLFFLLLWVGLFHSSESSIITEAEYWFIIHECCRCIFSWNLLIIVTFCRRLINWFDIFQKVDLFELFRFLNDRFIWLSGEFCKDASMIVYLGNLLTQRLFQCITLYLKGEFFRSCRVVNKCFYLF